MTKTKKTQVKEITSMNDDFAQWYTDVVLKSNLCDYTSVKGCMVIKPYGYAIWENIQSELNRVFKENSIQNVYLPMFIPESLLNKEKEHVEGFAPEVAWVTHGGADKLEERLCIRPTSETLFCDYFSREIRSWRDLPKLYNQWCSVVRWEKTTRPFLRSREFLWQEGHTAHTTLEEAEVQAMKMLNIYGDFLENYLSIPVIKGRKTEKEKFAGAVATYTIEAVMHDGKALQAGTSHNFGDGFAQAFKIQYLDKDNQLKYVYQTSWGMTTRLIGALIMVHGDDHGLVLPPKVSPYQIAIIPIKYDCLEVKMRVEEVFTELSNKYRVYVDETDHTPGYKFNDQEMKGIPLRIEIGPRDAENNTLTLVPRDTLIKEQIKIDELMVAVDNSLKKTQKNLYTKAKKRRDSMIMAAKGLNEFISQAKKPGIIKAMWCGCEACENVLKEKAECTSRCVPFVESKISECCVVCGKPAKHMVIWGKAY